MCVWGGHGAVALRRAVAWRSVESRSKTGHSDSVVKIHSDTTTTISVLHNKDVSASVTCHAVLLVYTRALRSGSALLRAAQHTCGACFALQVSKPPQGPPEAKRRAAGGEKNAIYVRICA